ncbi:MAG: PAS domain S-box protein [Candidatus Kapaibacterium sp.]
MTKQLLILSDSSQMLSGLAEKLRDHGISVSLGDNYNPDMPGVFLLTQPVVKNLNGCSHEYITIGNKELYEINKKPLLEASPEEATSALFLKAVKAINDELQERVFLPDLNDTSRAHLDKILDLIPAPVFYKDTKARYIGCNKRFSRDMLGMDKAEILGKTPLDLKNKYGEELAMVYYSHDLEILNKLKTLVYESKVRMSDKEERDFVFYKSPIFNRSELVGIMCTMWDVTEKNMISGKLSQSREQYKDLINMLPQAVFETDENGRISYMNIFGLGRFNYTEDQIKSKAGFWELFASTQRNSILENFKKLAHQGHKQTIASEYSAVSKHANIFPVILYINSIIQNGIFSGIRGIILDISDIEGLKTALRESEEQLRSTIMSMDDLVFVLDRNGVFINYFQPNYAGALIAPPEFFLGKHYADVLPPEIGTRLSECIKNVYDSGEVKEFEYHIEVEDGVLWYNAKISPRLDSSGEFAGLTIVARDITKSKLSAEALIKSEHKFRTVVEQIPGGIMLADSNGIITEWNPGMEHIFDMPRDNMLGTLVEDFDTNCRPIEGNEDVFATIDFKNIFENQKNVDATFERELLLRNGMFKYLHTHIFSIGKNDEWMLAFYVSDITESKISEIAIRESEKKYRILTENTPDIITRFDKELRIEYVNSAGIDVLGIDIKSFRNDKLNMLGLEEEFLRKFKETAERVFSTQKPLIRIIQLKSKIFEWHLIPEFNTKNRITSILCSARDITLIKQAEEKYRSLFENMADGILLQEIVYDNNGNPSNAIVREVNEAYLKMTGLSTNEVKGTDARTLLNEFDINSLLLDEFFEKISKGKSHSRELYVKSFGKWLLLTAFMVSADKFVTVMSDITTRKHAELEIQMLNKELESRVKTRTSQLEETLQELRFEIMARKKTEEHLLKAQQDMAVAFEREKELNELKSQFITTVSHEYRTPLSVILSSANLLENFFDTDNREKFIKHLDKIRHSTRNMVRMLENVLTYGKSEAGRLAYKEQLTDINELVLGVIEEITITDRHRHEIILNEPGEKVTLKTDPNLLYHILSNILSNACKYSDPGKEVLVDIKKNNRELQLSVKDRGIGISENDIQKLFEPFRRSEEVSAITGSGIGLSIVKTCADKIGAGILVESKKGRGSVFSIVLPINSVDERNKKNTNN